MSALSSATQRSVARVRRASVRGSAGSRLRRRAASAAPPRRTRARAGGPRAPARRRAHALGRQVRTAQRAGRTVEGACPLPSGCSTAMRAAVQPHQLVTSARPMPEPSWVRARAPWTRWKRSKSVRQLRRAGCRCRCRARASPTSSPVERRAHVDRALEGELERVGEQVEDDLLPHLAVDVDRLPAAAAQSTTSSRPARSNAERNALARSAVSAARSVGLEDAPRPARPRCARSRAAC